MIGNDIIDLQLSHEESNWQRRGWLSKLFTEAEQNYIRTSPQPGITVWLLWSMKESAYKICHRYIQKTFYAPHKFRCHAISYTAGRHSGIVTYGGSDFITSGIISSDFIHTVATIGNNLVNPTVYITDIEESHLKFPAEHVFFKDVHGIPYLKDGRTGKTKDISKSHHGRFEAISFF